MVPEDPSLRWLKWSVSHADSHSALVQLSWEGRVIEQQYTYREAAKILRVGESTLRRWVSKGAVPCHRLGRSVRFTDADLAAALIPYPAVSSDRPRRRAGRKRHR